jgi:hypothetical protein
MLSYYFTSRNFSFYLAITWTIFFRRSLEHSHALVFLISVHRGHNVG